jgi:hypothetical protein
LLLCFPLGPSLRSSVRPQRRFGTPNRLRPQLALILLQ